MNRDLGFVRSLDESFQDTLAPGALIVGLAYIAIGGVHSIFSTDELPFLGAVEFTTGLLTLALFAYCRGRRFPVSVGRVLGAAIVAPLLLNNGLYHNLDTEPRHAFGLYILIVGMGMIPFTRGWYAAIAGSAVSVWALSVLRSEAPIEGFVEPGIVLLATVALGSTMHVWRFRYAERLDVLREEAMRSHEARERFEARYRDMTERANDMISEIDQHGIVLYANPAHEVILGIKPEEIIGESCLGLIVEHGVEIDALLAGPPHKRVIVARHHDGTERTIESNLRPFETDSGERRLLITTRDITDRVASERALEAGHAELEALVEDRTAALRSSLRELQRADRLASMGTLAAGIAHQINNPIGSIQIGTEFALLASRSESGPPGDDHFERSDSEALLREALENNLEQAKRCGEIVSSMLQFARNEPTSKSSHDLATLLTRVCGQTDSYARKRLAVIDVSGIEGPLPVLVSAIEVEQALLNIIRNATESSLGAVHVAVSAHTEGDHAVVIVQDNGIGMEPSEVEHAFDPFFTTRLDRGGTGLGLSVAHGVVTDHGGTLSIESRKEKGTTIILRLPLERTSI